MKKIIVPCALLLVCCALAGAGCEEEEKGTLTILNRMGITVSHFSLVGFRDGENLIQDGVVLETDSSEPYEIPSEIEPGEYTWHVEYEGGLMSGEDGPAKVEIFPGPNDLALSR